MAIQSLDNLVFFMDPIVSLQDDDFIKEDNNFLITDTPEYLLMPTNVQSQQQIFNIKKPWKLWNT